MLKDLNTVKKVKDGLISFFFVISTVLVITVPIQEIFFKSDISGAYELSVSKIKGDKTSIVIIKKDIDVKDSLFFENNELLVSTLFYTFLLCSTLLTIMILTRIEQRLMVKNKKRLKKVPNKLKRKL